MDLLAQKFLNKSLREDCSKLWPFTLPRWRTGVDIMPIIVSSIHLPSGAVVSILDHFDAVKVKVSQKALGENHYIRSAAGAIEANIFTQSNGTMSIINSSSEQDGGAVHLGTSFWESFEMLLYSSRLWGCGRFILVVVSRLRTSCLMDLLAQRFFEQIYWRRLL